jgi:hypothetical protein
LIQVTQAGKAKLASTVHGGMIWERRIEASGLPSVGTHCLDTYAKDIAFHRK